MRHSIPTTRRNFVWTSTAVAGTLLLGGPIRRPGPPSAAAQTSAPPTVDRLAVRVLVDSYQDALVRTARVGSVEVQRFGAVFGPGVGKQLHSEFGLSLHLESQRGGETRQALLDFGWTPTVLFHNLDLLKIEPAAIDALVVSHGHFDHFGGLVPFLKRDRGKMRGELPLYVGGENTFCYRWVVPPGGQRQSFGVLDRRDLAAANVRVVLADKPAIIAGHGFTTGAIARTSFEKVIPNTQVEVGTRDGAGCDPAHFTKEEREGQLVFDNHWGEHATCFNVKDRGLVVISSCGHAGLINSIRQAQAASGVPKVHAAIGGFHLSPAPEPYIVQTVQALKELDVDHVIPMHCSGAGFIRVMQRDLPDRFIMSYTGTRYIFGA
jgi:7,8-dihydropterin-6-yl-methyl-4-(beta-D-ribofuranosyl)aminobenzene 5'-phosphate synthase